MRSDSKDAKPWVEHIADNNDKFGYRFVPLVRKITLCAPSIFLLLRRDSPEVSSECGETSTIALS